MTITRQDQRAGFPPTLELAEEVGMTEREWVKISQIRTLSTERLGKKMGRAGAEILDLLIEGLNEIVAARPLSKCCLGQDLRGQNPRASSWEVLLVLRSALLDSRRRRSRRGTSIRPQWGLSRFAGGGTINPRSEGQLADHCGPMLSTRPVGEAVPGVMPCDSGAFPLRSLQNARARPIPVQYLVRPRERRHGQTQGNAESNVGIAQRPHGDRGV
ncbi:MAG: type II toxin-antitoxin system PemK/MazF family toxin [Anaerolineales bacterium]